MSSSAPTAGAVLDVFDRLALPGTPMTTAEVAASFECTNRTIYNKLQTLVEDGTLDTKKVGARGRVWWRPVHDSDTSREGRVERVGRGRERRYRTLFDSISEGICIIEVLFDEDGEQVDYRFLETNAAFEKITGLVDVEGTRRRDLESDYDPRWFTLYGEVVRTGEPTRFEASGEPLIDGWYDIRAFPYGDPDSAQVALLIDDITERKRLERQLRTEKEQLDVAVENSPLTLFRLDTDLRYTWVKNAHLDFDVEQVLGKRDDELLPESEAEAIMAPKRAVLKTGNGVREEVTYTLPSGVVTYDLTVEPLHDESGEITGLICSSLDVTERTNAEQKLQRQAELDAFRIALADELRSIDDPVEIQNEAARLLGERLGVERAHYGEILADGTTNLIHADYCRAGVSSVVGEHHFEDYGEYIANAFRAGETLILDDFSTAPGLSEEEREAHRQQGVGAYMSVPLLKDGRFTAYFGATQSTPRTWTDIEVAMLEETAERTWEAVQRARAEQSRRESEERLRQANTSLERLNAASRELMDADTETVRRGVSERIRDVLDVEYVTFWWYDDASGGLRADARSVAPGIAVDSTWLPDESPAQAWQTFVRDRVDVANDLDVPETVSGTALRSRVLVPLGRHGVISAGSMRTDTFDERMVDLVETVAATVEAAWDRAEVEAALARQNEELARLDQLYSLVWQIDQTLVQADTVDEIDDAVCEGLSDSDVYEFAWIGAYDVGTDVVEPRAWAGIDGSYLDGLTAASTAADPASDEDPFVTAIRTAERQLIADIATDERAVSWREATLQRGARWCLSLPLVYEEFVYGVLVVYGGSQHDARDTTVLSELAQTVAHAINAVETTERFGTDGVVQLTVRSERAETPLCRLARTTDCVLEFEGQVARPNGEATVFFTVTGCDTDEFLTAGERSLSLTELTCLVDRSSGAFCKAQPAEPTLVSHVVGAGARVRSLSIDAGTATAVVELARSTDVREFVDRIRHVVPDVELVARRTRPRSLDAAYSLETGLARRLTPRQSEVIRAAYRAGFFESPRALSGRDLAAALDISPSTFSHHLREAERRLCALVFEDD